VPEYHLTRNIGTRPGRYFDPDQLQQDVEKLWRMPRIKRVNGPYIDRTPEGVIVTFEIVERKHIQRTMEGIDTFTQRAMGILTSSEFFNAMDITKESQATRDRYGYYDPSRAKGDGAPRVPQNLLLARRLIEAGVRVVTVNYSFWDWHGQNFKNAKDELPIFDRAVSALVEDLHERGLADDCTVVAWGEFGRTPKINKDAGRDHWPRVSCALLAGGGMKTGQAIGTTDRLGGEPATRPVTFEEVHATLYHNLGINLQTAPRLFDFRGRPQYLVEPGVEPIRELV
jgi:hypothetical protein